MEELKLLVEAVAKLPHMAIWALVVFYGYKVLIAGSIYGVIRFIAQKVHDAYIAKQEQKKQPIEYEFEGLILGDSTKNMVAAELTKLCGGSYFHQSDARKLQSAISAYLEKERQK